MPGPGVLIPTAAVFGGAAALGIGIFIGLNWDRIRDKAQMVFEENRILWEEAKVDFNLYSGPNSSDETEKEESERSQREYYGRYSPKPEEGADSSAFTTARSANDTEGLRRRNSNGSLYGIKDEINDGDDLYEPRETVREDKAKGAGLPGSAASKTGALDRDQQAAIREFTLYGETVSDSDTEQESGFSDFPEPISTMSDGLSSFEEIGSDEGFGSSPELI